MSGENKTLNLELNQWNGNEYPKRIDFIEDNKKIDEAYKELKDNIKNGGKVSSVNNKIGDVILKAEDIKTAAGITVESKLNELFQLADNGKKNIASIIGSPLSSSDTFDSMKSKIQTLKNTFASNLIVKEQSSSGSESLDSLINKIKNINPQKKWVEGNYQSGDVDVVSYNVSLKWKPSCIAVFRKDDYWNYSHGIAMFVTNSTFKNALTTNVYSSPLNEFNFIFSGSDRAQIRILSDTSFKIVDPYGGSATYYWLAVEL